ncbi:hypothetical protein Thimo_0679 [Thioflavicoccus mobilis 8321]|uniref:Uncharacterized protein n=1 Tax=Thioflavicoccus mobilis 8321 TaxID=765912 RepID=L0GS02_9GAMM|nr:hypothetical protein [Thioflavicoccus mobilis]AGA89518.1 hypothetical protein Thimo_0679 [Thioflavicoccus mobilis 8321]
MTDSEKDRSITDERRHLRVRLARIEADLAYFQARLELIGEPTSANQRAQRKLFKLLHEQMGTCLADAKAPSNELETAPGGQAD